MAFGECKRHPTTGVRSLLDLDWFPVERKAHEITRIAVFVFTLKREAFGGEVLWESELERDRNSCTSEFYEERKDEAKPQRSYKTIGNQALMGIFPEVFTLNINSRS